MSPKNGYNFDSFEPEFERIVEVFSAWGSSEDINSSGNTKPIVPGGKKIKEYSDGSIRKALNAGCRFGFVAGGLDDRGTYDSFFDEDYTQYTPGMTAILSDGMSREELFMALYNRHCYATTGERIILGIDLAGAVMGGELSTADKPGLMINRHLAGHVAGTDKLKTIEIVRNGKVLTSFEPDDYHFDYEYDDMEPFGKIAIQGKEGNFAYYYLKVTQEDGHMAWSSPIWVDEVKVSKKKAVV